MMAPPLWRTALGAAFCLAVLTAAQAAAAASSSPPVIPAPRVSEARAGTMKLLAGAPVTVPVGDAEAASVARLFSVMAARVGGPRLAPVTLSATPGIRFERDQAGGAGSAEAYTLDIGPAGVVVRARGTAGLFHGAMTLCQIIAAGRQTDGAAVLTGVHIDDAPRFAWRGLLLDSARHYQSVAEIERLLDAMALHKLNVLQWHLTDDQAWRLEIKRYPNLTAIGAWRGPDPILAGQGGDYGGFYSQAEVRHLVAYAAERQITIVPEIEMPGHALAAILADPSLGLNAGLTRENLGDWGVFPSIYNVDDHTFEVLEGVLTEVMDLFPSRYIHIGGDEAVTDTWLASPAARARMQAVGAPTGAALQSWFVRRIGAFLNAHGRRLIGWDDILQGGDLPAEDAVTSWRGDPSDVTRSGHDVVVASAPTLYFDNRQSGDPGEPPGRGQIISLRNVYAFEPPAGPHVLGVQANVWTEHIRTEARLEAMLFPRLAALAETGWSATERRSWPDFVQRLPGLMAMYQALGLHADQIALNMGRASDARLDGVKVARRASQDLKLCTDKLDLNLEGSGASPDARPVILIDILNPCWIYTGADMTSGAVLAVGVATVPFRYQLGAARAEIPLRPPATPAGELVARLDRCDGEVVAVLPLAAAPVDAGVSALRATVRPMAGRHDICLTFTARRLDPLWGVAWAGLEPAPVAGQVTR